MLECAVDMALLLLGLAWHRPLRQSHNHQAVASIQLKFLVQVQLMLTRGAVKLQCSSKPGTWDSRTLQSPVLPPNTL